MPTVIVENDLSQWNDETGAVYHFPKRYEKWLIPGTEVIYYKGRIRDKAFASSRLATDAHYFGVARVGKTYADPHSDKGDLFALIENYVPFQQAVMAKVNGDYWETIPPTQVRNYWRNGVRPISEDDYHAILQHAHLSPPAISSSKPMRGAGAKEKPFEFRSANEGSATSFFGTRYERRSDLRAKAIAIHGLNCTACGFNFGNTYGEYAEGFIHIHHLVPISTYGESKPVDPETDLVPLCANCHAVVHRKRDATLTLDELKAILKQRV